MSITIARRQINRFAQQARRTASRTRITHRRSARRPVRAPQTSQIARPRMQRAKLVSQFRLRPPNILWRPQIETLPIDGLPEDQIRRQQESEIQRQIAILEHQQAQLKQQLNYDTLYSPSLEKRLDDLRGKLKALNAQSFNGTTGIQASGGEIAQETLDAALFNGDKHAQQKVEQAIYYGDRSARQAIEEALGSRLYDEFAWSVLEKNLTNHGSAYCWARNLLEELAFSDSEFAWSVLERNADESWAKNTLNDSLLLERVRAIEILLHTDDLSGLIHAIESGYHKQVTKHLILLAKKDDPKASALIEQLIAEHNQELVEYLILEDNEKYIYHHSPNPASSYYRFLGSLEKADQPVHALDLWTVSAHSAQAPTTGYFDPHLGKNLPLIFSHPEKITTEPIPDLEQIKSISDRVMHKLNQEGTSHTMPLGAYEFRLIRQIISDRLEAIGRISPAFIKAFNEALNEILNPVSHVLQNIIGPRLSTPLESTLISLYGFAAKYALWGKRGWDNKLTIDPKSSHLIPKETVADHPNIHVITIPGTYESSPGFDYELHWQDPETGKDHTIATVGVIRRPQGYAIVKAQGMKPYNAKKKSPSGKEVSIPNYVGRLLRGSSGNNVLSWMTRYVLRKLRMGEPDLNFYWRIGERMAWYYQYYNLPDFPKIHGSTSLYSLSAILPAAQLADLASQIREEWELEVKPLREKKQTISSLRSEEAFKIYAELYMLESNLSQRPLPAVIAHHNRLPESMGFQKEEGESSWYILRPSDPRYRSL